MDKENIIKFIEWLPLNIDEFKNNNSEEVVNKLNELSNTEEGINIISDFITKFKESNKLFKKGGKIDLLIKKFNK